MSPIAIQTVKSHRVTCPYCYVGYVDVIGESRPGHVQIEGINDPRRCVTCGKYFRLQPRVELVGVQVEEEIRKCRI